jgi:uncharacterized protein YndB with AHSA1/START domain
MAKGRAKRTLPAASAAVWKVAADPLTLPEWWPRVVRVEGVSARSFTEVLQTERGRQVRADFRVTEQEQGRRRVWSQELEGTPFERMFASVVTEVRLQPQSPTETKVTVEVRQRLRGVQRLGGFLVSRAARRTVKAALDGLEEALAG